MRPNVDQQAFEVLEVRYSKLRAILRTLLPDGAYHPDAEPLDESVLADIEMIGAEMRVTCAALEALLTGRERSHRRMN